MRLNPVDVCMDVFGEDTDVGEVACEEHTFFRIPWIGIERWWVPVATYLTSAEVAPADLTGAQVGCPVFFLLPVP